MLHGKCARSLCTYSKVIWSHWKVLFNFTYGGEGEVNHTHFPVKNHVYFSACFLFWWSLWGVMYQWGCVYEDSLPSHSAYFQRVGHQCLHLFVVFFPSCCFQISYTALIFLYAFHVLKYTFISPFATHDLPFRMC